MSNEFSVYQFFKNGEYERVREFVDVDEAMKAFMHYTNNVAVIAGIIERVIITDGGDCTCAEWKHGEGYTFPPELAAASKRLQK